MLKEHEIKIELSYTIKVVSREELPSDTVANSVKEELEELITEEFGAESVELKVTHL